MQELKKKMNIPKKINAQMDAEFNEELIHLTNIGGISMGIKKRGSSHRVTDVNSDNLIAFTRRKLPDIDIFAVGKRVQEKKTSGLVCEEFVRGWIRREESEFSSHGRSNPTHEASVSEIGDSEKVLEVEDGRILEKREGKFTHSLERL